MNDPLPSPRGGLSGVDHRLDSLLEHMNEFGQGSPLQLTSALPVPPRPVPRKDHSFTHSGHFDTHRHVLDWEDRPPAPSNWLSFAQLGEFLPRSRGTFQSQLH